MAPAPAFVIFVAGILGIYSEFIWPGRVVPGLIGLAAAASGGYFLWQNSPTPTGLVLIGLAAVLFLVEALSPFDIWPGIAGIVFLVLGFRWLFESSRRISLAVELPICVVLGALTAYLCRAAKQSRRNKWSDVCGPK